MYKRGTIFFCLAVLAFLTTVTGVLGASGVIINGAKTYQTIEGFGVNANYYAWNNADLEPVLDALIDQAGMTQFRVIFNNGWETNNDNGDSTVMNWSYYNTVYSAPNAQKLWGIMGYLNQRGITNGITLNFQGVGPSWMMNGYQLANGYEDEWAEMITSLLMYARYTNQLQFNLVSPNNEPDITVEGINIPTVSQYLTTLRDLAVKMNTNGLTNMQFVVPDRSTSGTNWLPEIMTDSLIMSKVGHFGLHSYSSGGADSQGVSALLARSAYPNRTFWMTEFNVWCQICEYGPGGTNNWDYSRGTVDYLLSDLANGSSAGEVWEGYDSFYPHHGHWSFWGLFAVNDTNAVPKTYTPRKGFYALAQVAKYVRPGAVRIDSGGSISPLVALAFYQTNTGQLTIVGENTAGSPSLLTGQLTNLPPVNSLDFYYTDSSTNLNHSATVAISNRTFSVTIPADCVYTLSGIDVSHSSISVSITNPPDGTQYPAPAIIPLEALAIAVTGTVSSVAFYGNGALIAQFTNPPYSATWTNTIPGAYVLTATATNSFGDAAVSSTAQVFVTGPPAQIAIVPTNGVVVPYGTQQFDGVVEDAAGTVLDPQPDVSWSVNGGGTMDYDGTFMAGGTPGGPFMVTASAGPATGTASVVISTNVNVAPAGSGYFWYSLTASNGSSPQAAQGALNDGDIATDVILGPGGQQDIANAYEGAGVIWTVPQVINRAIYINGSRDAQNNGVFDSDFGLQFSTNGTTWSPAGAGWTLAPPYSYGSAASAHVQFTFNGPAVTVRGVRAVGRVHTSTGSTNSWVAHATEVEAFAAPGIPVPVLGAAPATNLVAIYWPAPLTNYLLESCTNPVPPQSWSPVTNTPQLVGDQLCVWVQPLGSLFFRLHQH